MSLSKKLVFVFLLVTMVPLSAIIGVLHYTFVEHAEGQVGARLEDSVIQCGKSADKFMFSCIHGMKDLAEDSELSSGDSDATRKKLSRCIHSFPLFRRSHACGHPRHGDRLLIPAEGGHVVVHSVRTTRVVFLSRRSVAPLGSFTFRT
jgi:hypothetical protein